MIRKRLSMLKSCVLLLFLVASSIGNDITPMPNTEITPIPIDKTEPHVKEFQRIDTNKDDKLTFTEFLLSDRPFLEHQSRRFHQFDLNGDGVVTKKEYEEYHKRMDNNRRRNDMFFNKFQRERNDPFQSGFFNGPFNKLNEDSREIHNSSPPIVLL